MFHCVEQSVIQWNQNICNLYGTKRWWLAFKSTFTFLFGGVYVCVCVYGWCPCVSASDCVGWWSMYVCRCNVYVCVLVCVCVCVCVRKEANCLRSNIGFCDGDVCLWECVLDTASGCCVLSRHPGMQFILLLCCSVCEHVSVGVCLWVCVQLVSVEFHRWLPKYILAMENDQSLHSLSKRVHTHTHTHRHSHTHTYNHTRHIDRLAREWLTCVGDR